MNRSAMLALCLCLWTQAAHAVEVKEVRSQSGLVAWLAEDHSLPLLAVKIVFREAGTASDTQALQGRAYLAGELLMEGSGGRDALAFQKEVESRAIRLSTAVDEDLLKISMETLSTEKAAAFALLGDMILRPRFEASAVERLKDRTLSHLRELESSPDYALQRAWVTAAFGAHPYGNPPYGTQATLPRLNRQAFFDFTRRYFARDNIVIAAAGDITEAELRSMLDKTLGVLPASSQPDHKISEVTLGHAGETIRVSKNIPQTVAAFGVNGVKRTDKEYFPAFVMNQVLGGGGSLNSRLGDEIREKRGLAYYVGSQIDSKLHAGVLSGEFATRNEKIDEAVGLLKTGVQTMREKGATPEEIKDAKQYLTGSFPLNLDSNGDVASYLISMQLYGLGKDYLDKRNELITAVSDAQVNDMAKRLLDPAKMLIVLVGKAAEKKP